jgi:AcrR family transcriptional regulator
MARPRSAGYDDQRDQILAQAAALFAQQGYTATSMNQVAAACGLSKAALYHYVRDKHALLALVAEGHVVRLQTVVEEVLAAQQPPEARLRELIVRFVREYANAQNEHRVLTEDVKFLADAERERVLGIERRVVSAFADTVAAVRPALKPADLHKPLTMLLFGMINWMFTWLKPAEAGARLTHEQMAPKVAELFFGGLGAVSLPATDNFPARKKTPRKETAL